jgi:glucosamine--fructose-6-phosphate aminotransferase (isomerizing)
MCGIVGYTGSQPASPIVLEGLRRLEYRGYDSAGVAIHNGRTLQTRKRKGRIDEGLARELATSPAPGNLGVGHTRWATHGPPSDENSHPHQDQSKRISVVHNGVIENDNAIRKRLAAKKHEFVSSTDSEVLAHLIGDHYARLEASSLNPPERFREAVEAALREVIGAYGIAAICSDCPDLIIGARRGSPLILGVGQGEHFLASDARAIVAHTQKVVYLNDYDIVTVRPDNFTVTNLGSDTAQVQISQIEFNEEAAERGTFPHYMLKEIFEQPQTVENALRGRIDRDECTARFGGLNMSNAELREIDRIVIPACGTSWHAALIAEYLIEELAHIPVEVEYASEFRYRNPPLEKHTLVLVITQSGETAETLAGLREARRRGHKVLSICNVVGSSIARESDGGIYLHAGPEIGVASTKAFTSQVAVLPLLALYLGRLRMLSPTLGSEIVTALASIPSQIQALLDQDHLIKEIALKYKNAENIYFLGRRYGFPTALESALKLKEISYIHAEGYPAAEMKHGPIALIDEESPSVVLALDGVLYEKILSNLQEIKARKGPVVALATEGNTTIQEHADNVIHLPPTLEPLSPLLAVIPLQLFAYHIAVARGCDVDKPRNLAKSVTVE